MSYWRREEKEIERILRGLMKLPENKRCINCNHLGPRYVCTSFWTFVCTVCSGVHREFGHRVKSVSMGHFNPQEVICLQDGGNKRASDIFLEAWDPIRNTHPDGSDIDRVRDFIKHVYVDKRYTGERRLDMNAIEKSVDKDNFSEHYSFEKSGLRSREDFYEKRYHERSRPSGRSERNHREYTDDRSNRNHNDAKDYRNQFEGSSPRSIYERFGSHRSRSSARFEIVDNRIRDDRYGRRRTESLKISSTDPDPSVSPEPRRRDDDGYGRRRSESLKISSTDPDPVSPEPQRRDDDRHGRRRSESLKKSSTDPDPSVSPEPQRRDDDGYGRRRSESLKKSSADTSMSPEPQRREEKADPMELEPQTTRKKPNPPVLRPLKEIMLDMTKNAAHPSKANKAKDADSTAYHQKAAISESRDSNDVKKVAKKTAGKSSLTDFKDNLETPDTSAKTQTDSGSSNQSSTDQKIPNPPSINSVEFLLFELSVAPVENASETPITETASSAEHNSSSTTPVASLTEPVASSNVPTASSTEHVASPTAPVTSSAAAATTESASTPKTPPAGFSETPASSTSVENAQTHPFSSADSVSQVAEEKTVQTTQQHQPPPPASPAENNHSTGPQDIPTFEAFFDQPWPSSPAPAAQEAPDNASASQSSQAVSKEAQTTKSPGNGSKSSERKELPAELFTFSYPRYPAPIHNWQFHPPQSMGYVMQYAPSPNAAAFPSPAKSTNPFDTEDDPRPVQGAMLPSIASVPGALPQMPPHAGLQPRPSPFPSGLPPESPAYGMYLPTGGYMGMGQPLPNNTSSQRPQGTGSFGGGSAFASFNPPQHYPGGYSSNPALGASNSFPSAGGNPFA